MCYIRRNPFIIRERKIRKEVLKGLIKEIKALCKEVVLIKKTYIKRLKQGLSSSSFSPFSSLLFFTPISFTFPLPFIFIKSKKKQL